jgi:hypothetical protein
MTDNSLREVGDAIARAVREHVNAPPLVQNRNRAVYGTWLIAAGVYAVGDFIARYDIDVRKLVAAFANDPQRTASDVGTPFVIWCAMILFGCLWVVVGLPNSRGRREAMGIFWWACSVLTFAYALARNAYLDGLPTANWYLKGFYIATLCSSLMGLFVFGRGPGGSALDQMTRVIADKNAPMVAARRDRPWWNFWWR